MESRMPRGDAARILLDSDTKVAGELLQGIAISRPEVAADIMQILRATDAGSMLVHLRPSTAAAVLQAMPTSEAAEIIGYAGEMTAAAIMMHLRAAVAVQLVAKLSAGPAERICRRMRPAAVAAMQKMEPDLINRLLEKASPEFRAEVRRYGRRLG
jgi:Mg/Co/Ni transporter MgtE